MADEPVEVRRVRGQALIEVSKEDLDLFGISELEERTQMLQAEIDRVRAHQAKKEAGRAAADALFTRRD